MSKDIDTNGAVGQFLTKKEDIPAPKKNTTTRKTTGTRKATVVTETKVVKKEINKSITISDIFDVKNVVEEGRTRSFYLKNKTYEKLQKKAKAKKMSTSKFLELILNKLFESE